MRWSLLFALKGIYDSPRPLMFALGLFCAYQGLVVFYMTCMGLEEEDEDPENSAMVIWFKKIMGDKLITKYQGSAFHVTLDGVGKYTPMFLVLMFIEVTDVAFCIDGVSTIFMVDHVHVWTLFLGDIVAACIVRALYPQLAGPVELFPDLNYSVACVLVMVGADMCCGVFGYDFPPGTLAVSMGVLFTLGMATSVLRGVCRIDDGEKDKGRASTDPRECGDRCQHHPLDPCGLGPETTADPAIVKYYPRLSALARARASIVLHAPSPSCVIPALGASPACLDSSRNTLAKSMALRHPTPPS